jgi:hypothetical protein
MTNDVTKITHMEGFHVLMNIVCIKKHKNVNNNNEGTTYIIYLP